MARRGELKDVASGLLGSFVSRNNDVGGYWGLGLLRSLADRDRINVLRFDLKAASAEPPDPIAASIAQNYHDMLARQLARRRIPSGLVLKAEITVQFGIDESLLASAPTYGERVSCAVLLLDGRAREHRQSILTACAPHNPARERRRGQPASSIVFLPARRS